MSKKLKKIIFPGTVLIASFYLSVLFTIGAIISYISTEFFLKKFLKTGKVNPLIFDFKEWEIHLHHWLLSGLIILIAYLLHFIYYLPIFFLGILVGLIFHDIYTDKKWCIDDKKWYQIVYKK